MHITYQCMKTIAHLQGRFPCKFMEDKYETIWCSKTNTVCEQLGKELPNE